MTIEEEIKIHEQLELSRYADLVNRLLKLSGGDSEEAQVSVDIAEQWAFAHAELRLSRFAQNLQRGREPSPEPSPLIVQAQAVAIAAERHAEAVAEHEQARAELLKGGES